jgi:hypothetical protein
MSASVVKPKDILASVSLDSLSLTISVFNDKVHFIESHASYLVSTLSLFSIWLHVSFMKFKTSFNIDVCSE